MARTNFTILSVGGSIIIPQTGFSAEFLKQFRALILSQVQLGKKFILVIGGGATCRAYQSAASAVVPMTSDELDWLGIKTTIFNAEFVKILFKDFAFEKVVTNPTKKVKTKKPIIIAAGWKPGCSTDKDAVLLAKTYGAKNIFNLSNVDYVYDSDPRSNPGAKRIEKMSWQAFRKIVGDEWKPGANVPFDPMAAKEAEKLGLQVGFVQGTDLSEVKKAIAGGIFLGSIIGANNNDAV